MKKQLVIVGIFVMLVVVGLSGCFENKNKNEITTISYAELIKDYDFTNMRFKSYKNGDVVHVRDTITNVVYADYFSTPLTLVYLSGNESLPISYLGDKSNEYVVGDTVTISVHVKDYGVESGVSQSITMPEEWYFYYISFAPEEPTEHPISEQIMFYQDNENDELLLIMVESTISGENWNNIMQVGSGSCNMPTGTITAGDRITECQGTIVLIWEPTNEFIGTWEFT